MQIISSLLATAGLLFQALNETAREDAEWILWMDLDTVAVQSDIAFPLEDYEGKDVVLWIQPELVLQGDAFRTSSSPAGSPPDMTSRAVPPQPPPFTPLLPHPS